MKSDKIRVPSQLLESFCQKHHIRSLDTFGSFACDDFWPDCDMDILVDFEPGHVPGFDFFLIEVELSGLLGHKVDLQTTSFLSSGVRQSALSKAMTVYE